MNIPTKKKLNELSTFFYNNEIIQKTTILNQLVVIENNNFNLTIAQKIAKYVYKCHKIEKERIFYRFDSLMNFLQIIYLKEV